MPASTFPAAQGPPSTPPMQSRPAYLGTQAPVTAGLDGRWANAGSVLLLLGGLVTAAGFFVQANYWFNLNPGSPSATQGAMETTWSLLGAGVLLLAIGWFLHQFAVFRAIRRATG
ncbi:MAG: hypothetical protein L3K13_05140 [Thermoplasmata archaeon]|nr:hypothetical protein [Thermoplasmata archaeon]